MNLSKSVKLKMIMSDKIKAIIIGPPLVGKTTAINYLRSNTSLPILELDEELVKLNN